MSFARINGRTALWVIATVIAAPAAAQTTVPAPAQATLPPQSQETASPGVPAATPEPPADTLPPSPQNIEAPVEETSEIVVTGTAIRGVAPVGSATVNLGRATLLESGPRDPAQLIQNLPQASGLGSTLTSSGGRASGVNLRGLGNNATLVLFDGHRVVPQGATGQISDPNQIPFAVIERVEVVTDGASAIYGSDAVAGVVNYIFRKDYDGAELTFRYDDTLYHRGVMEGIVGTTWSTGSAMLGFGLETGDGVRRSRRPYLLQDLRAYGGNDNRLIGTSVFVGDTPAIQIGNVIYGTPATDGRVPTAQEVLALRGNPSLQDLSLFQDFYAARDRFSAVARLRQEIGDTVELSYTGLFNRRETRATAADQGFNNIALTVTPASPYYTPGLVPNNGNYTLLYNLYTNNPDMELTQDSLDQSFNNTVDLRVDLPADFRMLAFATYGESKACGACQAQVNTAFFPVILQRFSDQFNPYEQGPQEGAELLTERVRQRGSFRLFDAVVKVDGALFDLPGGSVRVAAGGEYTYSRYHLTYESTLNLERVRSVKRDAGRNRDIKSLFGEIFVPLVGSDNALPFVERLDLNAALRWDDYSDFGTTTNPKFGATWKPIQDLTLRASWGTAFRAPTLAEITPGSVLIYNRAFVANATGDPAFPITVPGSGQSAFLTRTGNTAGLQPEKAEIWSVGGDLDASFLPGLKLGVTYYNVEYRDRIEPLPGGGTLLNSPTNLDLFRDFVVSAPQPSTCVQGDFSTYNPAYLPYLTEPGANYIASPINDCTLVGIIRGGQRNLGSVKQDGLDFTASYRRETNIGNFSIGGTFSKILNLQKSVVVDAPFFDALDTITFPVSERGRGNIGFSRNGLTMNAYVNYIGSYLNNQPITIAGQRQPESRVPSWVTFDAQVSYEPESETSLLSGMRFAVGLQNVTDKEPPIVLFGTNAVDLANANPFGRIWTFEISKRF